MGVEVNFQENITSSSYVGKFPASCFEKIKTFKVASIRLEGRYIPDGRDVQKNLCSSR